MTPDQLKELERLSERWANDCPTQAEWVDVGRDVMDMLPDVLIALKSDCGNVQCKQVHSLLNALLASMGVFGREDEASAVKALRVSEHIKQLTWDINAYRGALGYSVPGSHTGKLTDGTTPQCGLCNSEYRKGLEAERDALRDLVDKSTHVGWGNAFTNQITRIQSERDACETELAIWKNTSQLAHALAERDAARRALVEANKQIACDSDELCGKCYECQLAKLQKDRDAALKACAQKDDALQDCSQFPLGEDLHYKVCAALDDNTCGKGWLSPEAANEYRIGVMRELRRIAAEEWKPVVSALKEITIQECLLSHPDGNDCCLAESEVKRIAEEALAHAERITGGKQ